MLTLYTLPSVVALAIKLTIFWFGRHSFVSASAWLWMFFIGLFGMNLSELATFYYVTQPGAGFMWLSAYYISALIAFSSLLALSLSNASKLSPSIERAIIIFLGISILPLLMPGAALSGVKSIGYSITRVAGPYYFIVQLGILIPLISALLVSGYFFCNAGSRLVKRRSQIILIACMPIFISVIVIMLAMQLGYQLNASVILSLMISFTLMVLVYTEQKERQFKFMSMIPTTKEHQFVQNLTRLITDPTIGLEQGRDHIEKEMIKEALILMDGNKNKAAAMLGVSRQTLQRKLDKNIDKTKENVTIENGTT
jgi:hypothetical protein